MISGRSKKSARRPSRALIKRNGQKLPKVYLSGGAAVADDIFGSEHGDHSPLSRLKWIIGTCLAGMVGLGAIGFAIYVSADIEDGTGMIPSLKRASLDALKPFQPSMKKASSLRAAQQKTDKLQISAQGLSTRHIIHESVRERRGSREFIKIKPYVRIVARLATAQPDHLDIIPAFNPLKLYADLSPIASQTGDTNAASSNNNLAFRVVELVGGLLPDEDNQVLDDNEAARITEAFFSHR